MNVLYTATRNYYQYLVWSMRSLLDNNKNVKVYVFAEDNELPFDIPCEHKIINISGKEYFKPTSPNINTPYSVMSLMRVYAPKLIKANKLLYLDVDTIICDSLEPLWETDMNGKWVAWCPELKGKWKPYGERYFNFGIALMNLEQMRKDHVTTQLVDLLNTEYFPFNEQDALNKIITPDKYVESDIRYNECFCCGYTDEPAIVHYAGCRNWYENQTMFRKGFLDKYRGGTK